MLLEANKKDNVYLVYFKYSSGTPNPALNDFLNIEINEELYSFLWEDSFDNTLEIICNELSRVDGVEHIALVNTEAEIYKNGKKIGYSTPVIYRMEIVFSKDTQIYLKP